MDEVQADHSCEERHLRHDSSDVELVVDERSEARGEDAGAEGRVDLEQVLLDLRGDVGHLPQRGPIHGPLEACSRARHVSPK